jgi:hypothetical protein
MLTEMVNDIAAQVGLQLSKVSLVEGQRLGCTDTCLLNMSTKGHVVSALIYQTDIDNLKCGTNVDRLELRIRAALSRLQVMLLP